MYARHGILELILKALEAWISLWIRGSESRQSLFLYIGMKKSIKSIFLQTAYFLWLIVKIWISILAHFPQII